MDVFIGTEHRRRDQSAENAWSQVQADVWIIAARRSSEHWTGTERNVKQVWTVVRKTNKSLYTSAGLFVTLKKRIEGGFPRVGDIRKDFVKHEGRTTRA